MYASFSGRQHTGKHNGGRRRAYHHKKKSPQEKIANRQPSSSFAWRAGPHLTSHSHVGPHLLHLRLSNQSDHRVGRNTDLEGSSAHTREGNADGIIIMYTIVCTQNTRQRTTYQPPRLHFRVIMALASAEREEKWLSNEAMIVKY